ncbi:MAG TPA: hypothetical protein DIT04_05575 [Dysgonomonas sp.]|nr:hypothetical protein [Dysgonomonas sp.]
MKKLKKINDHALIRCVLILFVLNVIVMATSRLYAQVTIGSDLEPAKAALLEIKTKDGGDQGDVSSTGGGILFPRVEIEDLSRLNVFSGIADSEINSEEQQKRHKGLTVYNVGSNKQDGSINVEAGIYTWDGGKWQKAGIQKEVGFFYMPSIEIDLSTPPPAQGIDLYEKYEQQFTHPKAASTTDPIPVFGRSDLHYYITDYDEDIFDTVNVSADGKMTYTLQASLPAEVCCSFINIVFVVK